MGIQVVVEVGDLWCLQGKKKARGDASPSPVSKPGADPSPPFLASGPSHVSGFGPTDADRHACPLASDEAPEAQHAGMPSQLCVCLSFVSHTTDRVGLACVFVRFMHHT